MINRAFGIIVSLIIFFMISAVYINLNPSVIGAEIELMIILSGVWGMIPESLCLVCSVPVISGLIMSVYRGGMLLLNVVLCVFSAFLIFFLKDKECSFKPLLYSAVFVIRTFMSGELDFLYVFVNTLIFSVIYFCVSSIISRRTKYIF